MTLKEAESICQAYSSYYANVNELKNHDEGIYVFSSFDLPWSPAKLKYAFFIWAEDMVRNGDINQYFDSLVIVYGSIDGTFKEEADEINEDIVRISKIKDADKVKVERIKFEAKYGGISFANPDSGLAGEVEFQNFIADLTGNWIKDTK